YQPLNNNVNWLSTKIELLEKDLDVFCEEKHQRQKPKSIDIDISASIDIYISASIDTYEIPVEKFYTRAEVDEIINKIYEALNTTEERLDKRCDDIFFPFNNNINGLHS